MSSASLCGMQQHIQQYTTNNLNKSQATDLNPAAQSAPESLTPAASYQPPAPPVDFQASMQQMMQMMQSMLDMLMGRTQTQAQPQESINFNDNSSIQKRLSQLVGNNPTAIGLLNQLNRAEPQSPQAMQLQTQLASALETNGYSQGQIKQVISLQGVQALNNVISVLTSQAGTTMPPGTQQTQGIQSKIASIEAVKNGLVQQYQQNIQAG
jgi:hypothetical protein